MQDRGCDTFAMEFVLQDARDLHGPHAGCPLSAESLFLLRRFAVCAQRLKSLHLPQGPLASLPTDTLRE